MLKNWKAVLLALVLVDFTAYSVWVAMNQTLADGFAAAFANPWVGQVSIDLCISVAIALTFLWRDAKRNDINPVPFVVASCFLGSIGLMAYGVRRLWIPTGAPARTRVTSAA